MNDFVPGTGRLSRGLPMLEGRAMTHKATAAVPLIRKTFPMTTKVVNEAQGVVRAYVNSLGVLDMQNDIVERGAWTQLCADMRAGLANFPAILANHDWGVPVGVVTDAAEVGDRLQITGKFSLDTSAGRDWFSHVKNGVIKNWSVGFQPAADGHSYDHKGRHIISKIGMWPEVSCVLVGASPGTETIAVKSYQDRNSGYDAALRWIEDHAAEFEQMVLDKLNANRSQGTEVPKPYREPDPPRPVTGAVAAWAAAAEAEAAAEGLPVQALIRAGINTRPPLLFGGTPKSE